MKDKNRESKEIKEGSENTTGRDQQVITTRTAQGIKVKTRFQRRQLYTQLLDLGRNLSLIELWIYFFVVVVFGISF